MSTLFTIPLMRQHASIEEYVTWSNKLFMPIMELERWNSIRLMVERMANTMVLVLWRTTIFSGLLAKVFSSSVAKIYCNPTSLRLCFQPTRPARLFGTIRYLEARQQQIITNVVATKWHEAWSEDDTGVQAAWMKNQTLAYTCISS